MALAPVMAGWNMSIETIHYAGQPTTVSLYPHVLFVLLCLIGANALLGRWRPRWRFSAAELLVVYFFVLMAAVLASHDIVEVLVPILSYPFRYANAANRWDVDITPHIPEWLVVKDPGAVDRYWIGGASLWNAHDLGIWLRPALVWSGFLTVLCFGMFCLNALLRKHWTDHERLTYPLAQLPMDLVQPRVPLFGNRLFWIAFAVAAANDMWFGLHTLWPAIREPYTRWQTLEAYITAPPWNAIGWLPLAIYPWIIGLGVLLPLDLLISSSVFFWVWKMEPVVAAYYGYTDIPRFPFVAEQTVGAFFAIALYTLYTARRALAASYRSVWKPDPAIDAGEALTARTAWLGFAGSIAVLYGFFALTGMTWWVIAFTLTMYLAIAIAATRLRAELGTPAHDPGGSGPMRMIPLLFGTQGLRRPDLAMFAPLHGFNRGYRAHPMPTHAEGLFAASRTGTPLRAMFWVLVLAAFWGTLSGFLVNVHQNYHWGAASKCDPPFVSTIFGREPYDQIQSLIATGVSPAERRSATLAVLVGFFVTLALGAARLSIASFPLHPVGYAISSNWSMALMWFSLLVALICKAAIFKVGGLRAYRRALPFFLGLVLGDCSMGSAWMLVSIFTGTKSFIFWPYG